MHVLAKYTLLQNNLFVAWAMLLVYVLFLLALSRALPRAICPFLYSVLGLFSHAYFINPSFLLILPFLNSIIAPLHSFPQNKTSFVHNLQRILPRHIPKSKWRSLQIRPWYLSLVTEVALPQCSSLNTWPNIPVIPSTK
jgi:hypothetical protein